MYVEIHLSDGCSAKAVQSSVGAILVYLNDDVLSRILKTRVFLFCSLNLVERNLSWLREASTLQM